MVLESKTDAGFGVIALVMAMATAFLPHRLWWRLPSTGWRPSAPPSRRAFSRSWPARPSVFRASWRMPPLVDRESGRVGCRHARPDDWLRAGHGRRRGELVTNLLVPAAHVHGMAALYYLIGSGGVRAAAAPWFEDPVGNPALTGLDELVWREDATASQIGYQQLRRHAREGPETRGIASSAAPRRRSPAAIS